MTKSCAAFRLTAESLWQPGFRVYFWTFTFNTLHADWEAAALFRKFLNALRMTIGGDWGGVRVVELHKEHGVHYHALINRRLSVDIVRRVGRCHGIGRIHVCVADTQGAAAYLGKYLSKQKEGPKTESGRSARRWASFGPIRKTRVSDLVNYSPMWVYRREHQLGFLGYRWEAYLQRAWLYGEGTFKTCWFAARRGELGTVIGLCNGQLRSDGAAGVVEKPHWSVQPF